ncbi:oxaloacetate decarboxylase subunit alpha [Ruminococcus bicirculans]|uniref:Oxaloacetate decarboxylase subunit alpha n=1 Tax=Ruminococcus bicirculans (ex Wegman et al. 2014) TaxID=1160721 RepID=A0AAW6EDM9_9FIRM|nr:oxaloacetate decarboxylase subunit alpha [Ruminococcus bicirculans (ex Wegman et al. 2014)]MDB8749929.1 oxaloacetate decarboxylase subunit alpha [Ruminococcus bicirculans (ex Wegman et al. 2014)]
MAKLKITETVLRDAHQSLLATRMSMDDMREILPEIDKIGFYSAECWGGATFDSCIRFLNEDPWERLRILRKEMPNTKLQMLFRGQNMLGYRHYADDLVEYFVQKSIANGIDIIRIFDALNDIRNLETAIKAAKKENGHAQVAISYTLGEVFTHEYYMNYAKQIENAGADSICIKDMAALLTPYEAETLVKDLKSAVKIPIQLHTHYTSGLASMCILKAVNGLLDPSMLATNTNALLYQVPGGMLSNLLSQLKQAGKADQLDDVLKEVPKVRKDAGYPPLVTPTSQIVGTQAVFNVIMGERYKTVTKEFKGLVKGEYGKTPVAIDPEFQKKILGDEEPITCRPADLLQPEFETMKKEAAEWTEQEEDILTYAMFPKVAPKFFKDRRDRKYGVDGKHSDAENKVHPV